MRNIRQAALKCGKRPPIHCRHTTCWSGTVVIGSHRCGIRRCVAHIHISSPATATVPLLLPPPARLPPTLLLFLLLLFLLLLLLPLLPAEPCSHTTCRGGTVVIGPHKCGTRRCIVHVHINASATATVLLLLLPPALLLPLLPLPLLLLLLVLRLLRLWSLLLLLLLPLLLLPALPVGRPL